MAQWDNTPTWGRLGKTCPMPPVLPNSNYRTACTPEAQCFLLLTQASPQRCPENTPNFLCLNTRKTRRLVSSPSVKIWCREWCGKISDIFGCLYKLIHRRRCTPTTLLWFRQQHCRACKHIMCQCINTHMSFFLFQEEGELQSTLLSLWRSQKLIQMGG